MRMAKKRLSGKEVRKTGVSLSCDRAVISIHTPKTHSNALSERHLLTRVHILTTATTAPRWRLAELQDVTEENIYFLDA